MCLVVVCVSPGAGDPARQESLFVWSQRPFGVYAELTFSILGRLGRLLEPHSQINPLLSAI
jgi:hypothetical protein